MKKFKFDKYDELTFNFGMYNGCKVMNVCKANPKYVRWTTHNVRWTQEEAKEFDKVIEIHLNQDEGIEEYNQDEGIDWGENEINRKKEAQYERH